MSALLPAPASDRLGQRRGGRCADRRGHWLQQRRTVLDLSPGPGARPHPLHRLDPPGDEQNQARLEEALKIYQEDPEQGNIARVSAGIEGEFYGRLTRVEETIEFIRRMGYQKIGIASCVGLMPR